MTGTASANTSSRCQGKLNGSRQALCRPTQRNALAEQYAARHAPDHPRQPGTQCTAGGGGLCLVAKCDRLANRRGRGDIRECGESREHEYPGKRKQQRETTASAPHGRSAT